MGLEASIERVVASLGRAAPDLAGLVAYAELVRTWNARVNLTAARTDDALAEVLVADALVLSDGELVPRGARFVDVGSGAGAPALPLLLLRPDLDGTLVEPLRKRVAFLRTAIGALGLAPRARVLETRLGPAAPTLPGVPFDVALSRATLAPDEWLPLALGLAPRALVLTAQDAPPAGPIRHQTRYELPFTRAPRQVTAYEGTVPALRR